MRNKIYNIYRAFCLLLCAGCLFAQALPQTEVSALVTPKSFQLVQGQKMALSNSPEIKKIYNEILLKKIKYTESVKGIQAKVKNKRTLRWTPLLSFKLPEALTLIEEFELSVKPLALSAEITTLQHKMNDLKFTVLDKVNRAFQNVYMLQEKTAFTEEMLKLAETELTRNSARLAAGTAKQSDIDTMRQSVEKITGNLAQLMRNFQTAKEDLRDLIKLDVTTGYKFINPLQSAEISREQLAKLIEYTLKNDQAFYEAKAAESLALLNLNEYERLMRAKYGGKMSGIDPFINTARQGQEIDQAAFKIQYDAMLKAVDAPWAGKIKILFISFSKEFLKGEISGTRYIEDEMYALYTACMEYSAAVKDRESAEKALRKQISSDFESLVNAKNAVSSMQKTLDDTRIQLDRVTALNKTGKAEYGEVKDKLEDYQSLQLDTMDALSAYNGLLSSFDRLTCGGVTLLMSSQELEFEAGEGGLSLPGDDGSAYYYIYNDVSDMTFVFGLDIPEDFEPEFTHYELWYENAQIGRRTPKENQLRHLLLTTGGSEMLKVRLYNDDKFVDECEIDTTTPRDILPISKPALDGPLEKTIGAYKVETSGSDTVKTSKLTISFDASTGASFYRITYGDNDVYGSRFIPAAESFNYLTLLIADLDNVKLFVYDKNQGLLHEAWFSTEDQTIKTLIDE